MVCIWRWFSVQPGCLCLWLLWSSVACPFLVPSATPQSTETPSSTRRTLSSPKPCRFAISAAILADQWDCALGSLRLSASSQWSSAPTEAEPWFVFWAKRRSRVSLFICCDGARCCRFWSPMSNLCFQLVTSVFREPKGEQDGKNFVSNTRLINI